MVMVMKVTLLGTELFFVFLLSWINYLKSTWALHKTNGGQKADGSQTCWNTCGWTNIVSKLMSTNKDKTVRQSCVMFVRCTFFILLCYISKQSTQVKPQIRVKEVSKSEFPKGSNQMFQGMFYFRYPIKSLLYMDIMNTFMELYPMMIFL